MEGVRQSSVGQRVVRIFVDGLVEIVDGLPYVVVSELAPVIAALEIKIVGFPIFGLLRGELFLIFGANPQSQFLGNVADNFLLHSGNIGKLAIVLGPTDLRTIASINQ